MRLVRIPALALAAVLLTGCLGDMPSSGPIGYGRENSTAPDSNFVRAIVSPPQEGADPAGIVRGFMAAAAGDSGTFSTARLFLAPEVRDEWRPTSEIRVVTDRGMSWEYDNLRSPGLVTFSSTQIATINGQGEYRLDEAPFVTDYRLRLVNQEWRISALPDGLTLSQSELGRSYRSVAIYFPDRTRSVLVPNQIYLPVRPALATSMVRALLRGPTNWLAPSVRTSIPQGTSLIVNAVPIVDGVASIDLTENVARASAVDRSLLSAQLVHTLRQITEIRGVRITAGGVPLSVPGMDRVQPITSWSSVAPDAANSDALIYFSTPSGLSTLSLATPTSLARLFASNIPDYTRGMRRPGISFERDRVVAIDASGNVVTGELAAAPGDEVVISGLAVALPAQAQTFIAPRWDLTATYWTALDGTRSLRAYAGRIGSSPGRVDAPDWGEGRISAFAISRDGARAVVARSTGARASIYLLRVVRSGRGEDLRFSLQEPLRLATLSGTVTDLEWAGAAQVAALAGQPGVQRQIWTVNLDGALPSAAGPPVNAVSIAAAPGRSIIAETPDQRLLILRDQRWVELTVGRDPEYSG